MLQTMFSILEIALNGLMILQIAGITIAIAAAAKWASRI